MEVVDERQGASLWLTVAFTFFMLAAVNAWFWLTQAGGQASNSVYWYLSRSAAVVAYFQLAVTVFFGLSSSSGVWDSLKIRKQMTQIHQYLSLLVLPFIGIHIWATRMDTMVPFTWKAIFVPFESSYRPLFVGFGTLALYSILVVLLTSTFRQRLSAKTWRRVHYLSMPVFILVTIHGLFSGSDAGLPWMGALYGTSMGIFVWLFLYRVYFERTKRQMRRQPARG